MVIPLLILLHFLLSHILRGLLRCGREVLLHQYVPGTVVDVFETIRSQQDPAIPAGDYYQDILHIQNLLFSEA